MRDGAIWMRIAGCVAAVLWACSEDPGPVDTDVADTSDASSTDAVADLETDSTEDTLVHTTRPVETECDNGVDDDGDGRADCDDQDCKSDRRLCPQEICDNEIDDDGDGEVDGCDRDCENTTAHCVRPEDCDNAFDDDWDGDVDCADRDCRFDAACDP